MNTITLKDKLTGETVTFNTQSAAAQHTGVTEMTISRLVAGVQKTVANKRYALARSGEESPSKELYWRIYNSL